MELDLENLKKLCEAATPGPWSSGNEAVWNLGLRGSGNSPQCIAEYTTKEDAELIALMRNNISAFIAAYEALHATEESLLSANEYLETKIKKLQAENARLKRYDERGGVSDQDLKMLRMSHCITDLRDEVEKLQSQLARYEEVLRFYADEKNYEHSVMNLLDDKGQRAREALDEQS